jgi:hypothetical protein
MSDIYKQHTAAFANVSAFVILKDGKRVATIAFKYPRDSAGRLYAYVHWLGTEMVRGFAGGYGYDKASAACANAAPKLEFTDDEAKRFNVKNFEAFRAALAKDGGWRWDQMLEQAGFTVLQAV